MKTEVFLKDYNFFAEPAYIITVLYIVLHLMSPKTV